MKNKTTLRIISAFLALICLFSMSGCHMLDINLKWNIPWIKGTASAVQDEPSQQEEPVSETQTTTAPASTTQPTTETTTQPDNDALKLYNEAVENSTVLDVVLGTKMSSLTLDIGNKETFDGLGNVNDFSKEHELDAADFSLPDLTGANIQLEQTDTAYILTVSPESSDSFSQLLGADIPVRQITGYVYFLDIAAVDGILSLLGSDKADNAIYDGMGDGKVSLKNGTFTCEIDKSTHTFTKASIIFEETYDDIISFSFPEKVSADLTMNITLGFSF